MIFYNPFFPPPFPHEPFTNNNFQKSISPPPSEINKSQKKVSPKKPPKRDIFSEIQEPDTLILLCLIYFLYQQQNHTLIIYLLLLLLDNT